MVDTTMTGETGQLARALASFVRAEFEAPVHVVAGFIDLLIEDAGHDDHAVYRPDLEKMKAASDRLEGLVDILLETETTLEDHEIDAVSSKLRHDLRTPITAILGYGELLGEEARENGHHTLLGTLEGLIEAARRLLGQIDAMVDLLRLQPSGESAREPVPAHPAALPKAVEAIRAVLFDQPVFQQRITGRVLLVDDSVSNLDLLSRRLVRDGHEVECCESGQAALARLRYRKFDIVLLDLIMPGLNGIEVLRAIRADPKTRGLPVIMVSAMDEVDGAVRCIEAGADDFLSKPVNPILLQARINAALERKLLRDRESAITERLRAEQERSEALLRNILPASIVERLQAGETVIADHYDEATILFCDLVGFTALASRLSAGATLDLLNEIFSEFDGLADEYGLEKIKTVGDGYMVAGGLPRPRSDHAEAVADLAMRMPAAVRRASHGLNEPLNVRLGMHTGPVVAGIIGQNKFAYDVWGDTVNMASRLERYGVPGRVHISAATRRALGDRYRSEALPPVDIKGKGLTETFLLL